MTNATAQSARSKSSRPSLDVYLQQINRYPLLSREEEVDLARQAQNGDETAREKLIRGNLRFVVSVAKQYGNQGVALEDLVNEGNLGLVRAAERFDPERGFKFISYAVWWIRQAILQAISKQSRIVRVPLNRAGAFHRVGKTTRRLEHDLGRDPTNEEIAKELGVDVDEVEEARVMLMPSISLDSSASDEDGDSTMMDFIPDDTSPAPDENVMREIRARRLMLAVDSLPERERQILVMYFGLDGNKPHTLEAIGEKMHYTRERIRQLKEQAIDRLRHTSRAKYLAGFLNN